MRRLLSVLGSLLSVVYAKGAGEREGGHSTGMARRFPLRVLGGDDEGSSAVAGALRLLCVAAALGCGTVGYNHLFIEFLPWWRCLGELAIGSALLGIALRGAARPTESSVRRGLRRLAGLVALGATALGTYYWTQRERDISMVVAGGVAALAFVVARWVPFGADDVRGLIGDANGTTPQAERRNPRPLLLSVVSIGVAVGAGYVNVTQHFLAAFLLWLTSLVLFALAMWSVHDAPPDASPSPWLADGGPQLSRRTEAMAVLLVLALALALRLPMLAEYPALIDSDEGRQGRYAEQIWHDGFPDAFGQGWNGFAHLSYFADYLGAQLLGPSNVHLRLAAVVTGMLSLIPVFYWVRRWWGNVIGLLALLILSINHEHIYWSRIAFNNIQAVLVASLLLVTFARVLRTRRLIDWVWFGYTVGLAWHTYHAAKLYPALLAGAALLFAAGMRGFLRRYLRGALVAAVAFVLCCGPLLITIYFNWEEFYRNTSNRMDLYELAEAYHRGDVDAVHHYLYAHVAGTLLSFVNVPYRLGTFDPFLCVPFIIGVGWMLWRWRDPRHLVVLGWTAGIVVIASMLTSYPPNKPRLVGMLPVICVIPAVLAGRVRALAVRYFPVRADTLIAPLLIVWLGAALYHNWWTEFVYRAYIQRGDIMTALCRVIDNTETPAALYMAGEARPGDPKMAVIDCMIAPKRDRVIVNLPNDPLIVPIPPQHRGTAVLMLSPTQRELVPLVRHYYPEARADIVYTGDDNPSLFTFTIPARDVERQRGLRATYRSPTRTWTPREGSDVLRPPDDADFPLTATWLGQVWIAPPGQYAFRGLGAALRFDGQSIDGRKPIAIPAGWHTIELTTAFARSTDLVALEWRRPEVEDWKAIPRNLLNTHPQTHGLLGRYFNHAIEASTPTPIATSPDYAQIDAVLSFDSFDEIDDPSPPAFAARPSTMEWVGTVDLPEGNNQVLRIDTTSPTQVFINRTLVLTATGSLEGPPPETILSGLSGRVPILVRTARSADDKLNFWKLRLLWRTGGDGWTAFVGYHPPWDEGGARVE